MDVYSRSYLTRQRQPRGHLSTTHLNLLEMCEIISVDAAMSRAFIKQGIWGTK